MKTYTLLHRLHIFGTDAHPPNASEVPSRLALQVLSHDARKHDEFRVDVVEDLPVREIESVGDIFGDPRLGEAGISQ